MNDYLLLLEKSRFHTTLSPTLKETVGFFLARNPGLYKPRDEKKVNSDQVQMLRRALLRIYKIDVPVYYSGSKGGHSFAAIEVTKELKGTSRHLINAGQSRAWGERINPEFILRVDRVIDQEYQTADGRGKILLTSIDHHFMEGYILNPLKRRIRNKLETMNKGKSARGLNLSNPLRKKTLKEVYEMLGLDEEDFYETAADALLSNTNFKKRFVRIPNPSGLSSVRKIDYNYFRRPDPGSHGAIDPTAAAFYTGNPLEGSANWISILKRLKKHVEACSPNPSYHRWVLRAIKDHDFKVATIEDSGSVRDLLKDYDNLKKRRKITGREADIMFFGGHLAFYSLSEFVAKIMDEMPLSGDPEKEKELADEVKITDRGSYVEIIPLSERASCYYGRGTRWCTAARDVNMFKNYNSRGELVILVPKNGGRADRIQAFSSRADSYSQIMDIHDRPVIRDIDSFYEFFDKFPSMKRKFTYYSVPNFRGKEENMVEIKKYLESR